MGSHENLSEATQNRLKRLMDLGERTFSVLLFAGFAVRMSASLALRPWDVLVIVSEGLVVIFIVLRRTSLDVSTRPMDWLFALLGTAAPMALRAGGRPIVPPAAGIIVMLLGMILAIWGKLMLSRSFGLAAANRGVVSGGAYAFVRHPIYAGYVFVYMGFLSLNPTAWNAAVDLTVISLLVVRILAEERVLSKDPQYAAFMAKVRYRLAPGLF